MKKIYKKPSIIIEDFTLMEHISRRCGLDGGWSTHWDPGPGSNPVCGIRQFGPGEDEDILFYGSDGQPCNRDVLSMEDTTVPIDYHGREFESFGDLFSS